MEAPKVGWVDRDVMNRCRAGGLNMRNMWFKKVKGGWIGGAGSSCAILLVHAFLINLNGYKATIKSLSVEHPFSTYLRLDVLDEHIHIRGNSVARPLLELCEPVALQYDKLKLA